jgi:hypothetical protein
MQIREKGKKILCIRTEYKPDLKRTIGVTVASQNIGLSTVSEEVRQQLTKEEVDQLEKWLSSRTESQSVDGAKSSLSVAHYSVRRIANSMTVDGAIDSLTTENADLLWIALGDLQKALKKAGFPKPKPASKEVAQDDTTGQLPLDE